MILALDLSIASTGWVLYDPTTQKVVDKGTIRTASKDDTAVRLHKIRETLAEVNNQHTIDLVALERGFTRYNNSTQQLYRVHGVANELFWQVPQVYYPPSTVKKTVTGKGNASKKAVRKVVDEKLNIKTANNDEGDAGAVLLTYLMDI